MSQIIRVRARDRRVFGTSTRIVVAVLAPTPRDRRFHAVIVDQSDRVPPSRFLVSLSIDGDSQQGGTTSDHHPIPSRFESDRLRVFINQHRTPTMNTDNIHRQLVQFLRDLVYEITLAQRQRQQSTQRPHRAASWLSRFLRTRRITRKTRYLPRTPCTICLEDSPVNPVACNACEQLIGCLACVATWFGSPTDNELVPHVASDPTDNHSKCPLCRHPWNVQPDVFTVSFEQKQ